MIIIVYKLGGSLLSLPDLATRLESTLGLQDATQPLIVVGGGEAADVVRHWDRQHHLEEEQSHWLALRAMMLNESFLATMLPRAIVVHSRAEAETAWQNEYLPILCAHDFLKAEESTLARSPSKVESAVALPHNWDVTSDSIAAWVALRWPAARLVLLKSRPLVSRDDDDEPAVDRFFPTLVPRLPRIEWINLRAEALQVETWSDPAAVSMESPAGTENSCDASLTAPPVARVSSPL